MSAITLETAATILGRPELVKTGADNYSFISKDATLISYVTASVKQASAEIQDQCSRHAKFWGIHTECLAAVAKLAAYKPQELPDSVYALSEAYGDEKIQKYACVDANTTVDAAVAFCENRASYPLSWRKTASVKLLAKAARYNANLPEYVESYLHKAAGYAYPTMQSVEDAVVSRMNRLTKSAEVELTATLVELTASFDSEATQFDAELVKTAVDLLDQVDTFYGLTGAYGSDLQLPEEMCVRTLPALAKHAAAETADTVNLSNGETIRMSSLTKEALAAVESKLAGMDSSELADVLPTLPRGDADLLCRLVG